ncbi:MAG: NAD-dependent epimerase/dehydratase family protein [Thermoanaerobaculia bacterium]
MAIDIPRSARIYIAGHRGLVGSAIIRRLRQKGFENFLTASREQFDLRVQAAVSYWFRSYRPSTSSWSPAQSPTPARRGGPT